MNIQPEQILEDNLVKQLTKIGYERVKIKNESELLDNLKTQLEKHNKTTFLAEEFAKILNHLNKGNVFERAKILRDKMPLKRSDDSTFYVEFLNQEEWCKNEYQVTNQIEMVGSYKNRYDVTLLINGLPLAQIELKRRGLELKEAFNQINRYQRHSFWSSNGLFSYVQLFVISNGVNTKYFANNYGSGFKQTFYWADKDNNLITNLDQFASAFLEKCHLSKMICKYIVLHESDKLLMILRPYQYFAVENLIQRVKNSHKNGYIWHTTGSGKTLTSFKSAQLLMDIPKVYKVVFVVDRSDLDWQTTKEFNHFSDGSVDGTDNTKALANQLGNDTRLIVTTIQKLNTAISKTKYLKQIEHLQDKRVIFIFDECHRSQFGDTHNRIKSFFNKAQMFGFTGTPIFADNASKNDLGKRTTKDLFDECLHKYVITNAIKDENVLKFSVEYWGKLKKKDGSLLDEEVKGINIKEFFEHETRINQVTDWIIQNHNKKTHDKYFSSMFCVGSVDALIKYYETFKSKKLAGEHNLRIATIFTYGTNEDDANSDGLIPEPNFDIAKDETTHKHSREKLDEFIEDYNKTYKTKFSTKDSKSFYNYYRDIAKKMKSREKKNFLEKDRIDILLVVNMYLTGFDAKKLNTLYVDKNLKNHGLIQAFSRTNRILNEIKSQGNIVCFRNLKKATDDAVALFSNKDANEEIIMEPYEDYLEKFNEAIKVLKDIAPTVDSVNDLLSENEEMAFVKAFRNLMRLKNILQGFADFSFDDLEIESQEFEDYKSKYLDIYDKVKKDEGETTSIINDVDFELELIQRDDVNVAYILSLLANLYEESGSAQDIDDKIKRRKKDILDMLGNEAKLRSKRDLIEKFIEENLPSIGKKEDVKSIFSKYWDQERQKALAKIRDDESLITGDLVPIIDDYLFSGIEPTSQKIVDAIKEDKKPKILERKKVTHRIMDKIKEFIRTFEDDIGDIDS
jgi:type I restriction enzyme R subunit